MNNDPYKEPPIKNEEEKVKAYIVVQDLGETNMFNAQAVADLALEYCNTILERTDIAYIMRNYRELKEKYKL